MKPRPNMPAVSLCPSDLARPRRPGSRGAAVCSAIVALLAGVMPASLCAQETTADPPARSAAANEEVIELPEYTVTAEKVARPLQEVPMAVVAIDTKKLADFKLFSVQDIQNVSPGLNINTNDARNPIPSMRGVTFNPDSGTTSAVDVYWNETAVSAATAFRAMYDVGQIEVLRGPQGTLRGRSSPGGAITIGSRKPGLDTYGGSLELSASTENLFNAQASLNVPIVRSVLAVRFAGLYDGNDAGGIKNVVRNTESGSHTRSGRVSLEWRPNENFDLTLVHQVLEQKLDQLGIVQGSPVFSTTMPRNVSPFDRISVNPGPMRYDDKPTLSSLTAIWNLPGNHELAAIVGRQESETNTNVEFDNDRNIIPGWSHPQQLDIDGTNQTYELRFSSINREKWNYIFGAYYENGDSTVRIQQAAVKLWFDGPNPYVSSSPTPRAPDMVIPLDMLVTSDGSYRGVFTTQTLQLTEKWRLEAGLRYQQIKADSLQVDPGLGINTRSERDEKPTTGSVSLSYQQTKSLLFYATGGRSYRPGGEGFRSSAEQLEKYLHYNPETSMGVEVGVKSTWYNNRLQFNAALFHQDFDDYISHSGFVFADQNFDGISDNNFGITFNGDARTQGIEVGTAVSLPQRVVLNFDVTYVDAKWTRARSPATVVDANGVPVFNTPGEQVSYLTLDGEPLGDTPKIEVSSSIDWSRKVRSVELFTRGLIRYKGSRTLRNVADPEIGGYGIVDLFAGIRSPDGRWSVSVWAKNALDREVVVGREAAKNIGLWSSGYTGARVALPREFGITAGFSY